MSNKLCIVLPVYNEELILEKNTNILCDFLRRNIKDKCEILIIDNGSLDNTAKIAKRLSRKYSKEIKYLCIRKKGRGRALKVAWSNTQADIFGYMDIDLATNLEALPNLINSIKEGHDIAIGSRLLKNSQVKRSLLRTTTSRAYNLFLRKYLGVKFKDAQCGFKAVNQKVVKEILPKVKDNSWFFDTEMLTLAEKEGYKIKEIPVEWVEKRVSNRKSKVNLILVSLDYLKSVSNLKRRLKSLV